MAPRPLEWKDALLTTKDGSRVSLLLEDVLALRPQTLLRNQTKGLSGHLPEANVSFFSEHSGVVKGSTMRPRMFCSHERVSPTCNRRNRVGGVLMEAFQLMFHNEAAL